MLTCHAVKVVSDTMDALSREEREMVHNGDLHPAHESYLRHRTVVRLCPAAVPVTGDRHWQLLVRGA